MEQNPQPGTLAKWLVATRPFSFPASTMPVVFGTVLAVVFGGARFDLPLFVLSLVGMVILHSATNMISDVQDYRKGLDRVPTPVSGAVVRGYLPPSRVYAAAVLLYAAGAGIGLYLVSRVGLALLWIGIVGLLIGLFYTGRPFTLKYHALGDLAVFLDFGTLGALGAWTVQTGRPSWLPVIWSIPLSMLVVGILHANNWRDTGGDRDLGIRTVASTLGDRGAAGYYAVMVFGPFVLVTALVGLRLIAPGLLLGMPPAFLLVFAALPLSLRLWNRARRRAAPVGPLDFVALDGATAQVNLAFGLLCTAAAILHAIAARAL